MKKQTLVTLLLAVSAVISTLVVQAAVRYNVPEDNEGPFYARIASDEIYHNDDWAAIVFYRDPSCVPADFNLLEFFDFAPDPDFGLRVFGCPLTIAGFEVWKNGLGLDPAPIQVKSHGLGAVPVWFVSWPELQALVADDVLTIGELSSASSRRIGIASLYSETLHPTGGAQVSHITMDARGQLTDGTQFQFQAAASGDSFQHVLIRFR